MLTSNFIFGTDIQSSDEEEGVVRPKRVKSVPCTSFRFQQFINIILICRCLTDDEKVMQGLTTGHDAPLEVREGGICGRGVFATGEINKGSWLCEYRTTCVFPLAEKSVVEAEYDANGEGSYIIDSSFSFPQEGHLCFDATRKYDQLGRYLNHAQRPNAKLSRPFKVRGKWRVSFLACRVIGVGDEVVWDYGVRGKDWSGCRLVGGVVRKTLPMEVEDSGRDSDEEAMEARDGAGGEQKVVAGPTPPTKQARDGAGGEQKVVVGPAPHKSKGKNTYSMCQICHSGPHAKISNHFAQTHHLTKNQRANYLFGNRVVATPEQMRAKTRASIPVYRSQRTIRSVFKAMAERSEAGEVVEVESSDSETPDSPSPRRSPPGVGTAPLSPPTTRRASPSAPPRVTVTRTPPSTCVPTSQCDRPGPSSAFLGGKSTRNAPRFDPDEPFLPLLDEYLESRIGGKRDVTQHREICVDVSKYLCFADPDSCNPDHLLSGVLSGSTSRGWRRASYRS